jgi:hypothetical protein
MFLRSLLFGRPSRAPPPPCVQRGAGAADAAVAGGAGHRLCRRPLLQPARLLPPPPLVPHALPRRPLQGPHRQASRAGTCCSASLRRCAAAPCRTLQGQLWGAAGVIHSPCCAPAGLTAAPSTAPPPPRASSSSSCASSPPAYGEPAHAAGRACRAPPSLKPPAWLACSAFRYRPPPPPSLPPWPPGKCHLTHPWWWRACALPSWRPTTAPAPQ